MASGGPRARSGPSFDPKSARSDRRGISLTALPAEGFTGDVPEFPLPPTFGEDSTDERERQIWAEIWGTPQAAAWDGESWRWSVIGEYCRLKATVEADPSASAALVSQLHRYRDQIGLTPAGLKENGWAIARDEVAPRREAKAEPDEPKAAPKRRLRAVGDGG